MSSLEGAELRSRRRALGLTQAKLAERLAVSANTVARWERGELRVGRPRQVARGLERLERTTGTPADADLAAVRVHTSPRASSARHADGAPGSLPVELTTFVGRELEIGRITERLSSARLLTLLGPGGVGKTRLAVQIAARAIESHPHGVWFVELGRLPDARLVVSTIASALGVRERGRTPLVTTLVATLREQQTLLVLDNCEHVLDGCAELVHQLLRACSGLAIIATSREPLRISGEVRWPVPPLSEAVELFAVRAAAVQPEFALTPDNRPVVEEVCAQLDGLPLAIELAAARIGGIPLRALLHQLQSAAGRLTFLTGGPRDAPTRQQTLRAAIAWSYDLLDADERTLFRRLAPFRGCTLDAVQAVCVEPAHGARSTSVDLPQLSLAARNGLASLVDKNLLQVRDDEHGEAWFGMLETVREFALERLESSPEADALWRRYSWYYLQLADQSDGRETTGQNVLLDRLERERGNFGAALDWCQAHRYAEASLRLAVSLVWFWAVRAHLAEGRNRLESLLARFPLRNPSGERAIVHARATDALARIVGMQGDTDAARELGMRALDLFIALEHTTGISSALEALAFIARQQGDLDAARAYCERAVATLRSSGAPADRARRLMLSNALGNLGQLTHEQGESQKAIALLLDSIRQLGAGDHSPDSWPAWLYLARVLRDRGDLNAARQHAETALSILEHDADRRGLGLTLAELGSIATAERDFRHGYTYLERSLRINQELGELLGIAFVFDRLAVLACELGQHFRALRLVGSAASLREQAGVPASAADQREIERGIEPARRALGRLAAEVVDGGRRLTLTRALVEAEATAPPPDGAGAEPLSPREHEVALLVGAGQTNRQIAARLVISEGTVATHIHHILDKLELRSRAQVAAWVARYSLVDDLILPTGVDHAAVSR